MDVRVWIGLLLFLIYISVFYLRRGHGAGLAP
jgi:hypothetical protein